MVDGEYYWHITKGDLVEISSVAIPANDTCHQVLLKTRDPVDPVKFDTMAQLEKMLVANGFAPTRTKAHELVLLAKEKFNWFKAPTLDDDATNSSRVEETLKELQKQLAFMKSI
jgi:hypothetical protein